MVARQSPHKTAAAYHIWQTVTQATATIPPTHTCSARAVSSSARSSTSCCRAASTSCCISAPLVCHKFVGMALLWPAALPTTIVCASKAWQVCVRAAECVLRLQRVMAAELMAHRLDVAVQFSTLGLAAPLYELGTHVCAHVYTPRPVPRGTCARVCHLQCVTIVGECRHLLRCVALQPVHVGF